MDKIFTFISKENKALSVYPDPVQNTLQIVLAIYNARFVLYDLYGNLVQESHLLEGSLLDIDITVPTGTYVFELLGDNNERSIHKIIVE